MDEYLQQIFNEVTLMSPPLGAIIAGVLACAVQHIKNFSGILCFNAERRHDLCSWRSAALPKARQIRNAFHNGVTRCRQVDQKRLTDSPLQASSAVPQNRPNRTAELASSVLSALTVGTKPLTTR